MSGALRVVIDSGGLWVAKEDTRGGLEGLWVA